MAAVELDFIWLLERFNKTVAVAVTGWRVRWAVPPHPGLPPVGEKVSAGRMKGTTAKPLRGYDIV
jgi:hypothetical protein